MKYYKLITLADTFESLVKESFPKDSKELSTILNNLDELETFKERQEYAELNLDHISSGSSRIAYLTPNKTVIKLAKNKKGLAQNEAEANSKIESKYLNKVLDYSDDYIWIETKYLKSITEKEFEELTDIDFNDFGDCIKYQLRKISSDADMKKPKSFDDIKTKEIFLEISKIGKVNDLMPGDLARISSYGQLSGHPVLLDIGLTKKIFENLYE
jgi:hypothetical protein